MSLLENCLASSHHALTPDAVLALLSGVNAGLAIFEDDLSLSFANGRYLELFGYSAEEARPGVGLRDLAKISMERSGFEPIVIDEQIERGIERLRSAGGFSFRFTAPSGNSLFVHRQMLPDGRISEMVQKAISDGSGQLDHNLELMVEAARTRMTHAFESMADGFALYDAKDRLVVYNRKYVELNGHIADIIAPGLTYEEMLRIGMERMAMKPTG